VLGGTKPETPTHSKRRQRSTSAPYGGQLLLALSNKSFDALDFSFFATACDF